MLTVLAFFFAISLLVAIHELGHFGMAIACGVKVLRFSIGLGPVLWRWTSKKTGTEYAWSMFPVGGYVKMLDGREAPVPLEQRHQAFDSQRLYKRAAIVLAGPLANLVLAIGLYASLNWWGVERPEPIVSSPIAGSLADRAGLQGGDKVLRVALESDSAHMIQSFDDVSWWLTRAALEHQRVQLEVQSEKAVTRWIELDFQTFDSSVANAEMFRRIGLPGPQTRALIAEVVPGQAAHIAGLEAGDVVVRVGDVAIQDGNQLREWIRSAGVSGVAAAKTWEVVRGGRTLLIPVTPRVEFEGTLAIGRVGAAIGGMPVMVVVRYGVVQSIARALQSTWDFSVLSLKMIGKMLLGQASLKNLSGALSIADYAGKSAAMGWTQYVGFLAILSVSLGVLNLLPLPILDGGHLMYYLWEAITGRPVTGSALELLQRLGLGLLLMMMSIALFNDVTRLLG